LLERKVAAELTAAVFAVGAARAVTRQEEQITDADRANVIWFFDV